MHAFQIASIASTMSKRSLKRVDTALANRDLLRTYRIQELQQALAEVQQESAQAQEGRQQALAEAAARLRDAEDAGSLAVSAQEAADAAQARERAARQAAAEADARIEAAHTCVPVLMQGMQQEAASVDLHLLLACLRSHQMAHAR